MVVMRKTRVRSNRLVKKQKGGYKEPDQESLLKLQGFIKHNSYEFDKEYNKLLRSKPLYNLLLQTISGLRSVYKLKDVKLVLANLELIKAFCIEIMNAYDITQKEQEGKYKFLNRLAYKVDEDYCKKSEDKVLQYIDELSTFINTVIMKNLEKNPIGIFRVPNIRKFNYEIRTPDEVSDTKRASRTQKLNNNQTRPTRRNTGAPQGTMFQKLFGKYLQENGAAAESHSNSVRMSRASRRNSNNA